MNGTIEVCLCTCLEMYCLISSSVNWDPFDFATKATGTSPADSSFILNHYKHVFIMADQDSTPRVKDCAQNKEENNADLVFFPELHIFKMGSKFHYNRCIIELHSRHCKIFRICRMTGHIVILSI